MGLSSATSRNTYTGNGATSVYAYSFKIFAQTELVVVKRLISTGAETTLVLTTDYTVSGVGNAGGGNVTLVAGALASTYKIIIRRVRALTQTTDIRNQSAFYASSHEDVFDKLTMNDQQQQDELNRAAKLPVTFSTSDFDPTIPVGAIGGVSLTIVTNSLGTGFDVGPSTTTIASAITAGATAAASAAAAATSEAAALASQTAAASSATASSTSATASATSATASAASAVAAAASAALATGITALTGDVTASGSGSVAATIGAGKVTNTMLATAASAATASNVCVRDANANVAVNNVLENYTTTPTAAGTTVLTVASGYMQYFTGVTTQTVTLPVTSTLVLGQQFLITNLSTGTVTVQSSGANSIQAMTQNTALLVTCILTSGTTAASWSAQYQPLTAGAGTGTVTSVAASVPSVLSISGSPVTTTGTLAITYSGTALPIANGGTAQTAIVTAPAASTIPAWDANKNLSAQNHIDAYTTTATAAGTTTLVVGSTKQQYFTGATTQTVALPVATTLVNGQSFQITNTSSGVVTVQTSGANTVQAMAANTQLTVTCINTAGGTGTASWQWVYGQISNSLAATNPMTTGGDVIYGGVSGVPTRLANGSAGQVLTSAGTTLAPTWATAATGLLAVAAKTVAYTTLSTDNLLTFNMSGSSNASYAVTLLTAVGNTGLVQRFIITTGTGILSINTTSAQTIGGLASGAITLVAVNDSLTVVSDGANWQIISRVTAPCSLRYTGTVSTVSGSNSLTTFKTKDYDTHTAYTSGTFTVPAGRAGRYQINVGIYMLATFASGNQCRITIYKGASPISARSEFSANSGSCVVNTSDCLNLVAGETIQIQCTNAGTSPTLLDDATLTYLSICEIRGA